MSAIKNNLDRFPDTQAFDQGESFGRHVAGQELLPLLKEAALSLAMARIAIAGVIDNIERPPVTPKPTTPTDDESIPF